MYAIVSLYVKTDRETGAQDACVYGVRIFADLQRALHCALNARGDFSGVKKKLLEEDAAAQTPFWEYNYSRSEVYDADGAVVHLQW